ncbi:MAG: hypothetical protein Phog2KO_41030 [Phototrophicaceae bacterium]
MLKKSLIRLLTVFILLAGLSSVIYAQGGPLAYGTTLSDTLNPGSPIIYTFSGNANDVVTLYVIGDNALEASVNISNSSGQPLGFSNDDALTPMTNDVRVTSQLPTTDTYIVTVNNQGTTAGSFFLSLSVADPVALTPLLDRTVATIDPNGSGQAFSIAPNPTISQVLSVQGLSTSGFSAQLRNADGTLLASIPGGLEGTTFVLPANDTGYVLMLNAVDPTLGTQAEIAILAGGVAPTTDTSAPAPATTEEASAPAVTDPNVCTITSNQVNVRSGPSTDYDVIGSLTTGNQFIATGQNNGWYNGTYNGQSAWVAASVVTASGNCNLGFVDAPAAPQTTAPQETSPTSTATTSSETTAPTAPPTATTETTAPTATTAPPTATTAPPTATNTATATATTEVQFTVVSMTCRYFQNDGAYVDYRVEGAPNSTFQIEVRNNNTVYTETRTMNDQGFRTGNERIGQVGNSNYTAYIVYEGIDRRNDDC